MDDDKLTLTCVTLCRHCHKAIGLLSNWRVGWLHFSTHDGHRPEPMKPFIDHNVRIRT